MRARISTEEGRRLGAARVLEDRRELRDLGSAESPHEVTERSPRRVRLGLHAQRVDGAHHLGVRPRGRPDAEQDALGDGPVLVQRAELLAARDVHFMQALRELVAGLVRAPRLRGQPSLPCEPRVVGGGVLVKQEIGPVGDWLLLRSLDQRLGLGLDGLGRAEHPMRDTVNEARGGGDVMRLEGADSRHDHRAGRRGRAGRATACPRLGHEGQRARGRARRMLPGAGHHA